MSKKQCPFQSTPEKQELTQIISNQCGFDFSPHFEENGRRNCHLYFVVFLSLSG